MRVREWGLLIIVMVASSCGAGSVTTTVASSILSTAAVTTTAPGLLGGILVTEPDGCARCQELVDRLLELSQGAIPVTVEAGDPVAVRVVDTAGVVLGEWVGDTTQPVESERAFVGNAEAMLAVACLAFAEVAPCTLLAASSSTTEAPTTTTTTTPPPPEVTNPVEVSACFDPEACLHPLADQARWEVPVLSIAFLPDADGDGMIDYEATNWWGSVADLRDRIWRLNNAGAWWATEATRYRGEGRDSANPSLALRIVDQVEFIQAVPPGLQVPWNAEWHRPDYMGILADMDICRWIDGLGVREIWMWTQHYGGIEPAESNMSGPFGDISNSEGTDDLPACGHSYTLYNFNFTREVAMMLHNRGHQAERLFERGDSALWQRFTGDIGPTGDPATVYRCGNVHFPPNGEFDYDYSNYRSVTSDCLDWRPDGGTPATVNCSTWFAHVYGSPGCFADEGLAYYTWWFQAIPGWDNGLTFDGEKLTDWWLLFADLEAAAAGEGSWLRTSAEG